MNEQESCDKVTGRENGISNSYNEIKITTGRTLAQKKGKKLKFCPLLCKVRHSLPSSKRQPAFYLPSYLRIKDIMSFSLPNVDKFYKSAKLKLKLNPGRKNLFAP
jgi:hypothetical protein